MMRAEIKQRGFSLVELLVVVGIILVISAVAVPTVARQIRQYRLGSSAGLLANFIQRTRFEAIKRNTTVSCRLLPVNPITLLLDSDNDNAQDPNESVIVLPSDLGFVGGGPPVGTFNLGPVVTPAGAISFDARGTVVGVGASTSLTVLGFTADPEFGRKAITVTSQGKTKVWSAESGAAAWRYP